MPKEQRPVPVHHHIATFMTACLPVEKHLMAGKTLAPTELSSIITTMEGLQTALMVWKRKNNHPIQQSFMDTFAAPHSPGLKRKKKTVTQTRSR